MDGNVDYFGLPHAILLVAALNCTDILVVTLHSDLTTTPKGFSPQDFQVDYKVQTLL